MNDKDRVETHISDTDGGNFGRGYYQNHCGSLPYDRSTPHWGIFFGGIAETLIRSFRPSRVFDAGCALGFLVEAFWDRGVEAWGRDLSEFAISEIRPDLSQFCSLGSIADPIEGKFDLITCIEVLEHMPEAAAVQAIKAMTAASDRILFSSSPTDLIEPTHINVKPIIVWLRLFAAENFAPLMPYDPTFVTPHCVVFERTSQQPAEQLLLGYAEMVRLRIQRAVSDQAVSEFATHAQASEKAARHAEQVRDVAQQLADDAVTKASDLQEALATQVAATEVAKRQLEDQRELIEVYRALIDRLKRRSETARKELLKAGAEVGRPFSLLGWGQVRPLRRLSKRWPRAVRLGVNGSRLAWWLITLRPGRIVDWLRIRRQLRWDDATLRTDPMFDADFYRAQHMVNIDTSLVPSRHYLLVGRHEMRSPHPLFDMAWYIGTNPDVAAAGLDPLLHYIHSGRTEGRKPNPFFDPAWYLQQNPDVAAAGLDPICHFMQTGAIEGRDPSAAFQTRWYEQNYNDVAPSGMNPLAHFLLVGQNEGRKANGSIADFGASKPVTLTAIECRKTPILRREAALFVTHSHNGRLKPHVRHYLECLTREGIGVILIVAADQGFVDDEPRLYDLVDGLYVRANEGWDFACWAHVMLLNSHLYQVDILYWLNDSLIGPVSQKALHTLLERLRDNPAALIGLTANHECGRHLQSYFLAIKRKALGSLAFQEFVYDVECLPTKDDVINAYEIPFSRKLEDENITIAALFEPNLERNPTLYNWKQLLEAGFGFLKVQAVTLSMPDINKEGWREALQRQGYDVTLADRLLAELAIPPRRPLARGLAPVLPGSFLSRDGGPSDRSEFIALSAIEPRGRIAVVVHVYYEDIWPEISSALDNIDEPFDLFVTLVVGQSGGLIGDIKHSWPFAHILVVENHGRDILPLISIARTGILFRYELVCKLHTKRSPWHEDGDTWRQNLIKGVLGSQDTVRCILREFRTDPDLGLVVSDGQMFSGRFLWTGNEKHLNRLFPQFGMDEREFDKSFAGGSIFWIRTCLLRTIADLPVEFEDFEPEPIGKDGSLAHAIERLISLICYDSGMVIREANSILAASQSHSKNSEELSRHG